MEKVGAFTERTSAEGEWIAGNPSTGQKATPMLAAFFNMLQRELVAIPEAMGIALDVNDDGQLLASLTRLAARNVTTVVAADSPKALTVAEAGLVLVDASSGNVTLDLPPAAGNGGLRYTIARIDDSGNSVTLNPDGTNPDTIEGAASLAMVVGRRAVLEADGGDDWKAPVLIASDAEAQTFSAGKLIDGTALAAAFKGNNQSLQESGYQKLPGGLIAQWGVLSHSTGWVVVPFNIAYPNAALWVGLTDADSSAANMEFYGLDSGYGSSGLTTTDFRCTDNNGSGGRLRWFSIGY